MGLADTGQDEMFPVIAPHHTSCCGKFQVTSNSKHSQAAICHSLAVEGLLPATREQWPRQVANRVKDTFPKMSKQ